MMGNLRGEIFRISHFKISLSHSQVAVYTSDVFFRNAFLSASEICSICKSVPGCTIRVRTSPFQEVVIWWFLTNMMAYDSYSIL